MSKLWAKTNYILGKRKFLFKDKIKASFCNKSNFSVSILYSLLCTDCDNQKENKELDGR